MLKLDSSKQKLDTLTETKKNENSILIVIRWQKLYY